MNLDKRKHNAIEAFRNGYNCAQSVLIAFQSLKFDHATALSLAGGFGGGMGRLQKTCGAVTGSFMVFGAFNSSRFDDPVIIKSENLRMIRSFHERFVSESGSSECRELITHDLNTEEGRQKINDEKLSESVCEKCILRSVEICTDLMGTSI